jgi:acetamidase/formamidase
MTSLAHQLTTGRTGGQIKNDDSADDVKNVDLTRVHYLSGPFEVEGAAPGDVLLVEIMDVQPFQDRPWGFTGIFDRRNGVWPPESLETYMLTIHRVASSTRSIPLRMIFP